MASWFLDPLNGNDTTGNGTIGTPWKTTQKAVDNAAAGDFINIRSTQADTLTATLNFATGFSGTTTRDLPITFRGYTTTEADGGIGHINGGGFMVINDVNMDGVVFVDIKLTNYGSSFCVDIDDNCMMIRCVVDGGGTANGVSADFDFVMVGCSIVGVTNIITGNSRGVFVNNYCSIVSGTGAAIGTGSLFRGNIFRTAATGSANNVISLGAGIASVVTHNTFYSSVAATASALKTGTSDGAVVVNNYFEGFSGTGGTAIEVPSGAHDAVVAGNRFFNCSNDLTVTGSVRLSTENTALGSSGLTNASGGNYIPLAALIEAGWPSGFLELSGNAHDPDIGAVQKAAAAGGGAIVNQGLHAIESGIMA